MSAGTRAERGDGRIADQRPACAKRPHYRKRSRLPITRAEPDGPDVSVETGIEAGRSGHTLRTTVAAIGLALLPLLWQIAILGHRLPWRAAGGSDYAGLELDTRNALSAHQLLGTSSRLGVRNVGPFHSYWMAPWYGLTGHGIGGMILATWILHALAIVTVVLVVRSVLGLRPACLASIALCLAWLRAGPAALSDFYNPSLTVPAVLVVVVAAAAVARGGWRLLPVAALAATVAAQVHFAAAPGAVAIAAVSIALGLRHTKPTRRDLVVTTVLLAVVWSPTVIDQVVGTGNVGRLAGAVSKGPGDPDQPLGVPGRSGSRTERAESALQLTALTTPNASAQGMLSGVASGRPRPTLLRTATAGVLVAAALVGAWLCRRRAPVGSLVVLFALLGSGITYLMTARLERGFVSYYLAPTVGYALAISVGIGLLVSKLQMGRRQWAALGAVAALWTGVLSARSGDFGKLSVLRDPRPTAQIFFVRQVVDSVPRACVDRGVELKARTVQAADLWTLLVAFDKEGVPTTVRRSLEVIAGPGHRRTGREGVVVRVPTLSEFNARIVPNGSIELRACP